MRQPSIKIFILLLLFLGISLPTFSALKTGISYNIPIDYENLSENELELQAEKYYFNSTLVKEGIVNEDVTNALVLYSILQNINPENTKYMVRLGILYDKIGKDRFAKGNFARAISTNSKAPEPYFYYGNYYYKRDSFRKALKYYNEAYKRGYENNYEMLFKMGDIYEKLGDTRSALKYLQEAEKQSPNPEIKAKISRIEVKHSANKEYYSDTRIRKYETTND